MDESAGKGNAQDSGAVWYYATSAGKPEGPMELAALRQAVLDGTVAIDTAVWREGYGQNWVAAAKIPELREVWQEMERARIKAVSAGPLIVKSPAAAFREALGAVVAALFRPFSFITWVSIAFCNMMASTRLMSGGGAAVQPAVLPAADGAKPDFTAVATAFRDGITALFEPRISLSWLANVLLYGLLLAYICAKGRLLLVGKAFSPRDTIPSLWRRGIGRTASLLRLYYVLDCFLNFGFYSLVYAFFVKSGLHEGAVTGEALSSAFADPANGRLLVLALILLAAVEFARSVSFHFLEPLVHSLGVPVSVAARMVFRTIAGRAGAFLGFFAIVIACRLTYAAAVIVALSILPARLLMPLGLILLLPFDFLIRVFGTRFIQPATAAEYCDRTSSFRYKIDHDDLAFKLFTERGFEWGGDWTSCKDFQHFELIEE